MTVQDRIKHLEGLLVHLMRSQQTDSPGRGRASSGPQTPEASTLSERQKGIAPTAPDASSSPTTSDCGSIHLTKAGASYVNSAHWAAVLDGIAELKGHFEEEEEEEEQDVEHMGNQSAHLEATPAPGPSGPQLLYGCPPTVTKEEILASMPPRPVVDQLVSCYFNSFEMSPGQYIPYPVQMFGC